MRSTEAALQKEIEANVETLKVLAPAKSSYYSDMAQYAYLFEETTITLKAVCAPSFISKVLFQE